MIGNIKPPPEGVGFLCELLLLGISIQNFLKKGKIDHKVNKLIKKTKTVNIIWLLKISKNIFNLFS